MLGGLTIYSRVANFLQCIRAKIYENWLAVDKVIAKIIRLTFFGPPCITMQWRPSKIISVGRKMEGRGGAKCRSAEGEGLRRVRPA